MKNTVNPIAKYTKKLLAPANLFVILALIAGVFFIILTPPGTNDDEPTHYIRVQQIANGQIFNDIAPYPIYEQDTRADNDRLIGFGPIDKNAYNFIKSYKFGEKYSLPFDKILPNNQRYHSSNIITQTAGQATPNSPFAYIPLIAGVKIAEVFQLSLLNEFMLAKLLQLLVCVLLIYISIKTLPRGKWVLFALSVLPITVVQFAAFSHDGLTYCFAALLFSYIYKIIYEQKKLELQNYFILPLLAICLGGMKMTYFPIAALGILIPILNKNWHNWKGWILTLASFITSSAVCTFLTLKVSKVNPDITIFTESRINPDMQLSTIMHNPLYFVRAAFNSIFFQIPEPGAYLHARQQLTLFGVISGDRLLLQPWFMLSSILSVTFAIVITTTKKPLLVINSFQKKMFTAARYLIPLACLTLIYLTLYLAITPVREGYIWGVQTRYWLPFLPLLLIPQFAYIKLDEKIIKHLQTAMILLSVISLLDAVYSTGLQTFIDL
ncbi:MAG: DUF2142 domain-containing protein [Bifidobacteriaceae bacterium]|jgi:uncharacterized membrane protein|nr:DUF2142 domain-containing protein [Bifidobacteriaceae bacterium]